MSHTQVWLILKADSVSGLFYYAMLILGIGLLVYNFIIFMIWLFAEERIKRGIKRANVTLISVFLFCSLAFSLFPTTTELVKIHVIPMIVSGATVEQVKKIPPKLLSLLNVSMDSLIDWIGKGKK